MCYIANIYARRSNKPTVDWWDVYLRERVHICSQGSFDDGQWIPYQFIIGFEQQRLFIIDRSAVGTQQLPVVDTGNYIVVNNEISTPPPLCDELEVPNQQFRQHSGTMVLLKTVRNMALRWRAG